MSGLAYAQVGMQSVGMIADFVGAMDAAQKAKQAARREAMAEAKVTKERLRQLDVEEKRVRGETIGAVAGSGVKVGSESPLMILAEQAKEFGYQKKIVKEVGATKAAAAMRQGRNVGSQYKYQSYANLAKGASNIFSILNASGQQSDGGYNKQDRGGMGPPT
jgi:hypothetical protein